VLSAMRTADEKEKKKIRNYVFIAYKIHRCETCADSKKMIEESINDSMNTTI
jgi:hypothetical protein